MSKIVWLSDADIIGSGYGNITNSICNALVDLGHEVKEIGITYAGQEHWNKFSILPARDFNDVMAMIQNLYIRWKFDIFVCAMDIPHQEKLVVAMKNRPFKYIGLMALEAGPLCVSWAMALGMINKLFIISDFGTKEVEKLGLSAEHIQIGIDTEFWKVPTKEEKHALRGTLGIDDETFIVLTVADNQERKNPLVLMETYAKFSVGKKTKYIMVTRENNLAGARLRDYATEIGIAHHFLLMERGMPLKQLWGLYAISDAFLLLSKAEGLGMPILEAMSVGIPVIGTNCTGIADLLADGRGLLVDYNYTYRDCFGNGTRYLPVVEHGVSLLNEVYDKGFDTTPAREYVEKRTWDIPALQMDKAIKELVHNAINGQ